jgi:hypothetical protein
MKTIEIVVSPDGKARVETRGFTGSTCQEASRFLEQALGTRTREQLTSAYYEQPIQNAARLTEGGPVP